MTLFLNRNVDGGGLLECLMRNPSEKAYSFFDGAPSWFYAEVGQYFQRKGDFIRHVLPFVYKEINQIHSTNALFREDCLTSKFLNNCSLGKEHQRFMKKTLSPAVVRVLDKKLQLFDIKKLSTSESSEELEQLVQEIREIVDGILSRLYKHLDLCSVYYRTLLRNISEIVDEKFKDELLTRNVEASFFFLRFLCPALVSPVKYQVPRSKRGPTYTFFPSEFPLDATRSLVIVSKVLQAIGNGTGIEESKENWMHHFTTLVEEHQTKAVTILRRLIIFLNISEPSLMSTYQDSELIAAYLIESKQVSLLEPMHMRKRMELSVKTTSYIRNIIADERSLEKHIYNQMRVLPPLADSHPVTWTESEIEIWLCTAGLELYSPTFLAGKVSGLALLGVDREKIRDEWGVPRFENQTELLKPLKKLLRDSFKYISSQKAEDPIGTWKTEQILEWLAKIRCSSTDHESKLLDTPCKVFCSALESLEITGKQFLCLSEDDYCNLGLPPHLVISLVLRIREMEVASHFDYIHKYYTKTFGNAGRRRQTPSTYDIVTDDWLTSLNLVIEPTLFLRRMKGNKSAPNSPGIEKVQRRATDNARYDTFPTQLLRSQNSHYVFGLLSRQIEEMWTQRWYAINTKKATFLEFAKGVSPLSTSDIPQLKTSLNISLNDYTLQELEGKEDCITFSLSSKKKVFFFQTKEILLGKAWIKAYYVRSSHCDTYSRRRISKLNINLFSLPIVLIDKVSTKVIQINEAASDLFGFPDPSYGANKNKKVLFPQMTTHLLVYDRLKFNTMIKVYNSSPLEVSITVSEFVEGCTGHSRYLFLLRNNIRSSLSSSTLLLSVPGENNFRKSQEYPGSTGFLSYIEEQPLSQSLKTDKDFCRPKSQIISTPVPTEVIQLCPLSPQKFKRKKQRRKSIAKINLTSNFARNGLEAEAEAEVGTDVDTDTDEAKPVGFMYLIEEQ